MKNKAFLRIWLLFILFCGISYAQNRMTKSQQSTIIKDVCEKLEKYYTFPETGKKLSMTISDKFKKGDFSENVLPEQFVEELNNVLLKISDDKHLKIFYDPRLAKEMTETESEDDMTDSQIKAERWRNFGFKELKILDGNVGYMNLTDFSPVTYAGDKAVVAMNYFSDCRSLIIDLRQNGGGSDDMVVFLAGYFINSAESIVFNISYSTIDSSYYASMMPSYIPGIKLIDVPIYLLTSSATASAAEAFTDILKRYNQNVVIVGRKTRGAENPVNHVVVDKEYILRLPSWRKIYSSSKMKWEGTGIAPDIEIEEDRALVTAHLAVVKKLIQSTSDKDELSHYQWAYDGITATNDPVSVANDILKSYEGDYDGRIISYKQGALYYGPEMKRLIPVSETYFLVESIDYFRIKFIKEKKRVIAFERIFIYGYSSRHTKK